MSTERRSETNRSGSRSSGGNRAGSTAHRAGNTNVRRVNKKTAKADRILKLSGYVKVSKFIVSKKIKVEHQENLSRFKFF